MLLQKEVEISEDDTLGSVYFDKLFALGVEAMMEAVDLVRDGKAPKIPQDHSQATYESWCRKPDVKIDWSKPVNEVYNLIRGANPQPGAWTTFNGKKLDIYDCVKVSEPGGVPGEVSNVGEMNFRIAAAGGQIHVKRVRAEGDKKMTAGEFAQAGGLTDGARLG